MTERTCSVEGCGRPHSCRGLCHSHYMKLRQRGLPLPPPVRLLGATTEEKLRRNHRVDPETGCWRWTAAIDKEGYAQVRADGRRQKAHRVAYELWVGPIPDGLVLDHVTARGCVHRDCINPDHLEPVTSEENVRRGDNLNRTKTHCPKGHPYSEENTYVWGPSRFCRECKRDLERAKRKAS